MKKTLSLLIIFLLLTSSVFPASLEIDYFENATDLAMQQAYVTNGTGTTEIVNGSMETWSGGDNVAPDGWVNYLTTAKESTIVKVGTYSAHISRNGVNNSHLYQTFHATKGINYWKGKTVSFGCWFNSTYATEGDNTLYLNDGVTLHDGGTLTRDGNWHWVKGTATVNVNATELTIGCLLIDGYVDGAIVVEGNTIAEDGVLNYLQSYSESTIKTQGSYALKAVAAITDSLNKTLTKTFAVNSNLTGVKNLRFDAYALRTGSNFKIGLHDTGGTTTEITPNIATSNTWQPVNWDWSAVSDANKDNLDTCTITITNADAANTIILDYHEIAQNIDSFGWVN